MDPAYFTAEDIRMHECTACGAELEFWKDDVFLVCPVCRTKNANPRIQNTCLMWCRDAVKCLGGRDIEEWQLLHGSAGTDRKKEGG